MRCACVKRGRACVKRDYCFERACAVCVARRLLTSERGRQQGDRGGGELCGVAVLVSSGSRHTSRQEVRPSNTQIYSTLLG
eukprot:365336-Chlamydomonas_euryale.AAC.8